jgi:thymidylate synthase (FAD)
VNEESGRYSEKADEFYIPDPSVMGKQSSVNRQGREDTISPERQAIVLRLLREEAKSQYDNYQRILGMGLAKELARIHLGLFNYTQWYWKIDLHNLMHFLRLRLDKHAQWEFRQYGEAIARIVKDAVPSSYRAFEDYVLHAITFSVIETLVLGGYEWPMPLADLDKIIPIHFKDKLEGREFIEKLKEINFIKEG